MLNRWLIFGEQNNYIFTYGRKEKMYLLQEGAASF